MEHNTQFSEVTHHHAPSEGTGRIWKTFWILLVITIIELALGFTMYFVPGMPDWLHLFVKGVICILSLAKAFYIVSIFMHLGDEIRNMIMTIVVPLMLFVWFIGAFLWDGNSYRTMRNRYDEYKKEKTMEHPVQKGDTTQHGFGG
jgi:cytochrome c oxidase subunit IV